MQDFKVTVVTSRGKKIELARATTPRAALNKVQRAPQGWYWVECSLDERGSLWGATVKVPGDKYTHFRLEDCG